MATTTPPSSGGATEQQPSWEYRLRKYLLLLATLVASVTYGAGFNPPGGVWQETVRDPVRGHIAGDPIIRQTSPGRYLAFFYSNATAFASSLVVIVLVLVLALLHERGSTSLAPLGILRAVMVLDLLSLMAAYAAGAFRDTLTATYSLVLLAGAVLYLAGQTAWASLSSAGRGADGEPDPERLRKVLMLLATFAVSVTYVAGLSAPGGFWDHREGVHRPGDAVLKGGRRDGRLKAFFVGNTTAFVASLLVIVMLLDRRLSLSQRVRPYQLYGFIALVLSGLVAAYAAGSSRDAGTTIFVSDLTGGALVFVAVQAVLLTYDQQDIDKCCLWSKVQGIHEKASGWLRRAEQCCLGFKTGNGSDDEGSESMEKARSLVLLLATLAATITYQAGLNPPGGLWQGDGDGYKAGDPILLTANPRRYSAFYYCNSVAFVASLVAIVLVRRDALHQHNALEAAMILDLFGLIGAYAAGSCRDVSTSIYAAALAGAVLVYVVIHVVFCTLDDGGRTGTGGSGGGGEAEEEMVVQKRRKRLLLFAILGATITDQAGLTPPTGFLAKDDEAPGHLAGDPVLLANFPRRYEAFFYCNSMSFMLSMALIILLVNPNLYRPAIRSYALSVCTAAGMMGVIGAYAAGSTQHLETSYYIFALAAFVFFSVLLLVVVFLVINEKKRRVGASCSKNNKIPDQSAMGDGTEIMETTMSNVSALSVHVQGTPDTRGKEHKKLHAKLKYLMLLGILVASVTYQAGLVPPGGVWQGNGGSSHEAGDPVMYSNRRSRYLAFYCCNSTSFVASIAVIVLLLPPTLNREWLRPWWLAVMNTTIVLDLLGLLIAYAAGSSRSFKTSLYVLTLVIAVLAFLLIHVKVSSFIKGWKKNRGFIKG